ncbi:hypothetical protein ACYULU_14835 [Breznakiellaceae bacterium SP9]
MKHKVFLVGMLAMVLTFGMAVIGCDNGSTSDSGGGNSSGGNSDAFAGTWMRNNGSGKITAGNGTFRWYDDLDDDSSTPLEETIQGTYTVSGNSVTMTITQANMIIIGDPSEWKTWAQLEADGETDIFGYSNTMTAIINGNRLTDEDSATYTKQ